MPKDDLPNDPAHEASGLQFELTQARLAGAEPAPTDRIPLRGQSAPRPVCSLSVGADDGLLWVAPTAPEAQGDWTRLAGPQPDALGFGITHRAYATALALVSLRDDVFINGVPALGMSLLEPKDTVLLADLHRLFYLTVRFRPAVGPPPRPFLGQKCPACHLAFEPDTAVVSCACGAAYHHETAGTHPHLPPSERLDCFSRVGACQNCQHSLTTEEYLVWDPESVG